MLMQVGAYEVLLDDTRAAAKKARAEGVKVRCSVYDGMFHVFPDGTRPDSGEPRGVGRGRGISADHLPDSSGAGGNGREKGKNDETETEDRARLNLLAFLKRELKK